MRSLRLHTALQELIEQAAGALREQLAGGAEVGFELEPRSRRHGGSGPALYCYRALTGEFIAEHAPALEELPGYGSAVALLAKFDGLDRYLASARPAVAWPARVSARARARAAIVVLLEDVFAEQTDFEPRPERVAGALERLEQAALAGGGELTLVATLHGVAIASTELVLARGLRVARPDALEGLPDAAAAASEEGEHLVVVLACEREESRGAMAQGADVLRDLLRALRLFGDGRVTLGALAWARGGAGPWSPLALDCRGHPHGMLVVSEDQEDELRAFCNLASRRAPHGDALAWALQRYELGCERESPYEALTDHLLALRALLEPEGPASGMLPGRLAALCAPPVRRVELTQRTLQAVALEQDFIAGRAREHAGGHALARGIADHLRALLRDVICGHLPPDLVALADEILLSPQEPSAEEMLGDASEAEEVLDLLI